jgi:general secretion pathway protein K
LGNERGAALIIVLWIFIFLFVVAFDFSAAVREEGMATHRYAEETEGYYLALAGFQQGVYEVMRQFAPGRPGSAPVATDMFESNWKKGNLGDGVYEVRFIDESGKFNLNRANEETLRSIFRNLGVEQDRANILTDSILDWIDPDDLHRLNGAESDYYMSLSPPYTAKNGPFDSVEDLLWVRGVTPELFYGDEERVGLRDIFSVDSPAGGVNLRTASPAVCVALVGISMEKCQDFIARRAQLSEKTLADLLRLLGIQDDSLVRRQIVFANPTVITIEARGHQAQSTISRQVKGVVRVIGSDRYDLVRWLDRDVIRSGSGEPVNG